MNTDEKTPQVLSPEQIAAEKNLDRSKFFLNGKAKKSSKLNEAEKPQISASSQTAQSAGQTSINSQTPPPEPLRIPYGLFSGFIFLLLKFLNFFAKFLNYELIEDKELVAAKIKEADIAYTDFLNLNKKQVSNGFKIFLSICSMFTSFVTLFRKKETKKPEILTNLTLMKNEKKDDKPAAT